MFVYDSENDEYNEIYPHSISDASSRRSSTTSSGISIKSTCSDIYTRIISKTGRLNVYSTKINNKKLFYFRDWGNTLLNVRWRWILVTIVLLNFVSFILFGLMWMWIAYISGDFGENVEKVCVENTRHLTGYIMLSMETILTTGYGYRYPTEHCQHGWLIMFLQALVSIGIEGAMVTLVYVKIAKPFTRNALGIFSRKAVISMRDGNLCFIFRIVDVSDKVSVGTRIAIYLVGGDGEEDLFSLKEMKVEPFGCLIFPLEIVHIINEKSPLWDLTPHFLLAKRIEVMVVAEGTSLVTSQQSQIRMSYRSTDILWGHRFKSCVKFNTKKETFVVNYKKFNETFQFDTPLCSAAELSCVENLYYQI